MERLFGCCRNKDPSDTGGEQGSLLLLMGYLCFVCLFVFKFSTGLQSRSLGHLSLSWNLIRPILAA